MYRTSTRPIGRNDFPHRQLLGRRVYNTLLVESDLGELSSPILDMFPNPADILVSLAHKTFFEGINEQSIGTDIFRPVDIDPILSQLRALGSNDSLSVNDFTTKLCWLLGACSFLRPSRHRAYPFQLVWMDFQLREARFPSAGRS